MKGRLVLTSYFSICLLFFLLTMCRGYMPGESAYALTQALPDSLFPSFGFTLWHNMIRLVDVALPGPLWWKVNSLHALFGALLSTSLLRLAGRIRLGDTPEEQGSPLAESKRRLICMVTTGVIALFHPSIWFASTRAFPQLFGSCCLVWLASLSMRTFQERSPKLLRLCSFLWGVLVTEFASTWFSLPIFAAAVLATSFDVQGRFRWGRNLKLLGLFLLGALLGYLFMSFKVLNHPHAEIQGMSNLWEAFRNSLMVQKNLMQEAAPLQGSLLVLFLFGGPLLLVFMPKQYGTHEVQFGSILLHLSCLIINAVLLFHPKVSPWGLYRAGELQVFMVLPAGCLALSTGYLFAYWSTLSFQYNAYAPSLGRRIAWLRRALITPGLCLLLCVSSVGNVLQMQSMQIRELHIWARKLSDSLRRVELYVGESGMNQVLQLQLRDRKNTRTHILGLSPALWSRSVYREIIAQRYEAYPRLQSMARLGPIPLVIEWLAMGKDAPGRLRLVDQPELLYRAGMVALPHQFGYEAAENPTVELLREQAIQLFPIWRAMPVEGLWDDSRKGLYIQRERMQAGLESKRANNLGVLLEAEGEYQMADECYRLARVLNPDNLSALMNLLTQPEGMTDAEKQDLEAEFEESIAKLGGLKLQQARLAQRSGYISHPLAYQERGMSWVMSGVPGAAVRELRKAIRQAPGAEILRLQLASALSADQDFDAAEAEFLSLLEGNPEHVQALVGLYRLNALQGNVEETRIYLQRAAEALGEEGKAFVEQNEVLLMMMEGRMQEAKAEIEALQKNNPDHIQLWLLRLEIANLDRDREEQELVENELRSLEDLPLQARGVLAMQALRSGRVEQAKKDAEAMLALGANSMATWNLLLQISVARRDQEEAQRWVDAILTQQPGHPQANYILGSLRYAEGELKEAESAYRRAIQVESIPAAYNDLANLLLEMGEKEEARELALKAVDLSPDSPSFLDTLAMAELEQGRLDEAYQHQLQALALAPQAVPLKLTLARIHAARGEVMVLRPLLQELLPYQQQFSPYQQAQLQKLLQEQGL